MLRIGLVLYPGFQVLNLSVTTVFEFANITAGEAFYDVVLLSPQGGPVLSSAGFAVATQAFDDSRFDTVLVVGDNDVSEPPPGLTAFLQQAAQTSRRIGSTCTGAFNLAQAGLLDGRRATTHWAFAAQFRRTYPAVKLEEDRIFIIDGPVWTSAGMTACVDLALALVEKDMGAELARLVAKKLVVYHRRAGGQSQYSALLDLEPRSDRIQTALAYAKQHLHTELSVEQLAQAAHLSPRQFSRVFTVETGQSPAKAIEGLRLEAARLMIEKSRHSLEVVARETGFRDRRHMREAFMRGFGLPPQEVRREGRAGGRTGV